MLALPCLRYSKKYTKPLPTSYLIDPQTIGEHIKKRRMDLGLFQRDIAQLWNVTEETITNWENNRNKPQINFFPLIISFLGYNPFLELGNSSTEKQIYSYRCANGLSYKRLGKLLYVDASTIRAWEQGKRLPSYKMMLLLNRF